MTTEDAKQYVKTLVELEFSQASAAFAKSAHGENWARLEQAMYALQGLRNPRVTTDEKLAVILTLPISQWPEWIASQHKGGK